MTSMSQEKNIALLITAMHNLKITAPTLGILTYILFQPNKKLHLIEIARRFDKSVSFIEDVVYGLKLKGFKLDVDSSPKKKEVITKKNRAFNYGALARC